MVEENKIINNEPEVRDRVSTVGMTKAYKNLSIATIVLLTIGALFYIFFSGDSTESTKKQIEKEIQETKKAAEPVMIERNPLATLPTKLPELPTLVAPLDPPPLPKQQQIIAPYPTVLPKENSQPSLPNIIQNQPNYVPIPNIIEKKGRKMIQNRNTPMLVISGSQSRIANKVGIDTSDPTTIVSADNLNKIKDSLKTKQEVIDEDAPLERTSSVQVKATYIGDLDIIIAQGKLIDAVLETSVNTDLKGMLRAIVSRDVYSESGKNVLLPKGSKLIGEYKSTVSNSQVRVDIIWNRVMRPDGIDLQIQSPATDQLGKAGIGGQVDTKFGHLLMNSFLVSSVKIAGAAIVKKLFPTADGSSSVTTSKDGTVTDNTPVSSKIATDAINNLTKTFETVIKQYENSKPTIRIDQGARIKVFVNKDLVFSHNLNNRVKITN